MQYIGRLMRDVDPAPIRARSPSSRAARRRPPRATAASKRWRERLIADDAALTAFAAEHPGADLQALRTLIRNARKEQKEGKPPRAYRELFRVLERRLKLQTASSRLRSRSPRRRSSATRRRAAAASSTSPAGASRGERLSGRVLPGGADWQVIRADGVADLDARYTLETHDGALIYVRNRGLPARPGRGPAENSPREKTWIPSLYYMRTTPRFETGDARYAWLNRIVCVATGARRAAAVELEVFEIQ